ncbi:MAG: hypothetical protein KDD68_18275 [Bdellovibrionales bacterium]|nr:hypothetical protein [Bdellovibrionales bacterium]
MKSIGPSFSETGGLGPHDPSEPHLVTTTNVGFSSTTGKLGVRKRIRNGSQVNVTGTVYGKGQLVYFDNGSPSIPNPSVGFESTQQFQLDGDTTLHSSGRIETKLKGGNPRLIGRSRLKTRVSDQAVLTVSSGYSKVKQGSTLSGEAQLDHQISDRGTFTAGASHHISSGRGSDFRVEARYNQMLGDLPKDKTGKKSDPWLEILRGHRNLESGGTEFGDEPLTLSLLAANYMAFADRLESATEASPGFLGPMMDSNLNSGLPLGVPFDRNKAVQCRKDIVTAARAYGLFYYQRLQKKYPFYQAPRSLHQQLPAIEQTRSADLSVHKDCLVSGSTYQSGKSVILGTQ